MIIEKITGNLDEIEIGNRSVDLVVLDHHDLSRPHQKVTTQHGKILGISLARGEHLFKGAVLFSDEKEIIAIELSEEDVFEIRPKGSIEWARVGFNIGNMHQAAYVSENDICIPYDPVMEKMIHSLGVEYHRKTRKLDGIRANVSILSSGHDHSHDHHPHEPVSDHPAHESHHHGSEENHRE